jgi:hypothetical protein
MAGAMTILSKAPGDSQKTLGNKMKEQMLPSGG